MALYYPPTENLPIFDVKVFRLGQDVVAYAATSGSSTTTTKIDLTSDNSAGSYYIPFSKTTTATSNVLYIDDTTTPLTYNPSTATVTTEAYIATGVQPLASDASTKVPTTAWVQDAITAGGGGGGSNATTVNLTSDNTAGTYYIPFSKTVTASNNILYVDNVTTPLTYNPSTSALTTSQLLATGTTQSTFTADITVGTNMRVGHGNNNIATNMVFGTNALLNCTTSTEQVALGNNTLRNHNGASGINVAIGSNALQMGFAPYGNIAIGTNALIKCEGNGNIAIGLEVLRNLTSGTSNTAIGTGACFLTTIGANNLALGVDALRRNTTGVDNLALGNAALYNGNSTRNVGVGFRAGFSNLTGSLSTYIGALADCLVAGNFSNSVGIGTGATVTESNQIIIGTAAETQVIQGQFNWNFGTIITASVALSIPLKTMYIITSVAATTITLPNPVALHTGVRLLFKRKTNTQVITITTVAGLLTMYAYNAVVTATTVSITALQYQCEMICDGVSWLQINTM